MENFKYCIWFVPTRGHIWHKYTNNFTAHMSIKTYLDLDDAKKQFKNLKSEKINVELIGKLRHTYFNNFYALEYAIKPIGTPPNFWPENAHISFEYRYNYPFTQEEIDNLEKIIKVKTGTLEYIKLNKCSGHYSKWKKFN